MSGAAPAKRESNKYVEPIIQNGNLSLFAWYEKKIYFRVLLLNLYDFVVPFYIQLLCILAQCFATLDVLMLFSSPKTSNVTHLITKVNQRWAR
jgi:hypothetical protein